MKILILTPIPIEYEKVREYLGKESLHSVQHDGVQYEEGHFQGKYHSFQIIITQTGSKNVDVALRTKMAIEQYQPDVAILTGIAGGVKDVKIGDVVIANKLYGYESGKETKEGFVSRPEVFTCSLDLVAHAQKVALTEDWKSRSSYAENSKVVTGPIISGDKVIATIDSPIYRRIKRHFNDTTALEMEASGFGKVMLYHPTIKYINIRGISDLLDDKTKTDGEGGQEVAITNVVSFVFEMIRQLDFNQLNLKGLIHPKQIVQNNLEHWVEEITESSVDRIEDLAQQNHLRPALILFLMMTKKENKSLHQKAILLGNRWNRLMNEKETISRTEYNIELNKIIIALLHYLEKFKGL